MMINSCIGVNETPAALGDIELAVPRTRRFAPIAVVRAYGRRPKQVDRMILSCFVLGLSVRKVGEALLPILGQPISLSTASTVAKQLDAVVAAFTRPLKDRYRVLMLDGVELARRTGAGVVGVCPILRNKAGRGSRSDRYSAARDCPCKCRRVRQSERRWQRHPT